MTAYCLHPEFIAERDRLQETWDDPRFRHPPGTLVNESQGGAPAVAGEGDGGQEGAGEGGEQPAQPATMEAMESAFDQRFAQMQDNLLDALGGQQGREGEGEPEEGDPDYGQLAQQFIDQQIEENDGEITAEGLQQFVAMQSQAAVQQALQEALPHALQEALQPIHDRFHEQDADQVVQRYPALQDPGTRDAVIREAVEFAQRLGNVELARNPALIEQMYLARCAREGTAAVPASGQEAQLETGQVANGGQPEGPSVQEQIVGAGPRGLFDGAF